MSSRAAFVGAWFAIATAAAGLGALLVDDGGARAPLVQAHAPAPRLAATPRASVVLEAPPPASTAAEPARPAPLPAGAAPARADEQGSALAAAPRALVTGTPAHPALAALEAPRLEAREDAACARTNQLLVDVAGDPGRPIETRVAALDKVWFSPRELPGRTLSRSLERLASGDDLGLRGRALEILGRAARAGSDDSRRALERLAYCGVSEPLRAAATAALGRGERAP